MEPVCGGFVRISGAALCGLLATGGMVAFHDRADGRRSGSYNVLAVEREDGTGRTFNVKFSAGRVSFAAFVRTEG